MRGLGHRAASLLLLLFTAASLMACRARQTKESETSQQPKPQQIEERSSWPSLCSSVCERASECSADTTESGTSAATEDGLQSAALARGGGGPDDHDLESTTGGAETRSEFWTVVDCSQDCSEVTMTSAAWQVLAACDTTPSCETWLECVETDYRKRSATLMAVPGASEVCEAFCRQSVLCGAAVEAELRNDEYVEILSRTYGARVECVDSCELERALHGEPTIHACVETKTCAEFERCAEKL